MISEQFFYAWMVNKKGLTEDAAQENLQRVQQIDAHYDLFTACFADDYAQVRAALEYTQEEAQRGETPKHTIPLAGDPYNETLLLKNALALHIESEADDDYFDQWMQQTTGAEDDPLDVSSQQFQQILEGYREMGPVDDEQVRKMLASMKDH